MAETTQVTEEDGLGRRARRRIKRLRRRALAIAAWSILAICRPLPFRLTRRLFPPVIGFFANLVLRRQIIANLEYAFDGELDPREVKRIRREVCRNLGLIVAELLALTSGKLPKGYIQPDGLCPIDRAVGHAGGFVALSGHLANWECLAWLMFEHWQDRAGAVIARRNANEYLNRIIDKTRHDLGVRTIYQDDSPLRSLRLLRDGKIVATVPDQDIRRISGIFVPFFGKPAYTPTGPAMLAVAANVPICAGFARRTPNGIVLHCPEPIWPDPNAPRDAEIERLTREWSRQVEEQIRKQPSDWMWFHRRWRTTPESLAARRLSRPATRDRELARQRQMQA